MKRVKIDMKHLLFLFGAALLVLAQTIPASARTCNSVPNSYWWGDREAQENYFVEWTNDAPSVYFYDRWHLEAVKIRPELLAEYDKKHGTWVLHGPVPNELVKDIHHRWYLHRRDFRDCLGSYIWRAGSAGPRHHALYERGYTYAHVYDQEHYAYAPLFNYREQHRRHRRHTTVHYSQPRPRVIVYNPQHRVVADYTGHRVHHKRHHSAKRHHHKRHHGAKRHHHKRHHGAKRHHKRHRGAKRRH